MSRISSGGGDATRYNHFSQSEFLKKRVMLCFASRRRSKGPATEFGRRGENGENCAATLVPGAGSDILEIRPAGERPNSFSNSNIVGKNLMTGPRPILTSSWTPFAGRSRIAEGITEPGSSSQRSCCGPPTAESGHWERWRSWQSGRCRPCREGIPPSVFIGRCKLDGGLTQPSG